MIYSLILSIVLAQYGFFPMQSPFKQLPNANNLAVATIFSDGIDSKPAGQLMAAGMLPRYLPISTDGYDSGDMWMYGFHGQTEQDVVNAAKARYPMSAAMGRPEDSELWPLWGQIVHAGLNVDPASASAASSETSAGAASDANASFGPASAGESGEGSEASTADAVVVDGTDAGASTSADSSTGSTVTDTGATDTAAAEGTVADGAASSDSSAADSTADGTVTDGAADSGATDVASSEASTDAGASSSNDAGSSATDTGAANNGMPPFNPAFFDFEEFAERMGDMAEEGFFPMQNGGATGNILPFQNAGAGASSGNIMPFFGGQIEEAGDSESAFQGAAMGCMGMQNEATVLCMMKPDQTECNKCAIAGCVWTGSHCMAMGMLESMHRHKHHYLKESRSESNSEIAPTSFNPVFAGLVGISFGVLIGCGIGSLYSRYADNKSPLEEKILS